MFCAWVAYLREVKLFGPEDALFPKAQVGVVEGKGFANMGLARDGFANGAKLNLDHSRCVCRCPVAAIYAA